MGGDDCIPLDSLVVKPSMEHVLNALLNACPAKCVCRMRRSSRTTPPSSTTTMAAVTTMAAAAATGEPTNVKTRTHQC